MISVLSEFSCLSMKPFESVLLEILALFPNLQTKVEHRFQGLNSSLQDRNVMYHHQQAVNISKVGAAAQLGKLRITPMASHQARRPTTATIIIIIIVTIIIITTTKRSEVHENHENRPKTMNNYETTLKNHDNTMEKSLKQ